jgi:phosphoglycerol transferase MdoB-like AlkP superfamily enzyme
MGVLDQFFGWAMVALGVAHYVSGFRLQPLSQLTVLLSGTAVAMIAAGFLNVTRSRQGDGLARAFSVISNLLVLLLAVGLAWPVRYHLLHDWQRLGIIIVAGMELLFALW